MTLWVEAPLCQHTAKFDSHIHCGSGEVTFLIGHMIKDAFDVMGLIPP